MRQVLRLGFVAAFVAIIAAGGLSFAMSGSPTGPSTKVDLDIDARRSKLEQRISEARQSGKLRGLSYMALLDEQHRLLVKQRRAEAHGMSPEDRRALLDDIAKASANIDRKIGK